MLARAMGWEFVESPDGRRRFCDPDLTEGRGGLFFQDNLYDLTNMALAWRVLNWALEKAAHITEPFSLIFDKWYFGFFFGEERGDEFYKILPTLEPAQAQAAWLDKILELAIEGGLVEPS